MSYGIISGETRDYVEKRARQGNVFDQIKLESDGETDPLVSVIVDGALDEEFNVGYDYAVNICDWIAELLTETCDTSFWEVILSDSNGDTLYKTAGFTECD